MEDIIIAEIYRIISGLVVIIISGTLGWAFKKINKNSDNIEKYSSGMQTMQTNLNLYQVNTEKELRQISSTLRSLMELSNKTDEKITESVNKEIKAVYSRIERMERDNRTELNELAKGLNQLIGEIRVSNNLMEFFKSFIAEKSN